MSLSRGIICKFQLIFLPKQREPGNLNIFGYHRLTKTINENNPKIQKFLKMITLYILLFLNFKGNHVAFWSDAIGYNIRLHASTPIVVCFDILLILCPLRVKQSNISELCFSFFLTGIMWRKILLHLYWKKNTWTQEQKIQVLINIL